MTSPDRLDLLSDVEGALEAYTRVIDRAEGPTPIIPLCNRAYALLRAFHPERALTDADRALDLLTRFRGEAGERPERLANEALAHRCVAAAYELLGDPAAALDACTRSLELLAAAGPEEDTLGYVAEMKAQLGSLLLASGDADAALAATTEAVETLHTIVEQGHRQSEMDLVKALRAHASALRGPDPKLALEVLRDAEEITTRWIGAGGAFQDVLADALLRRSLVLHDLGRSKEACAALARGRQLLAELIAAGRTYVLPELVRHTAEHVAIEPERAAELLGDLVEAARATAPRPGADELPPSSLLSRRRQHLFATLEARGHLDGLDATLVAALSALG